MLITNAPLHGSRVQRVATLTVRPPARINHRLIFEYFQGFEKLKTDSRLHRPNAGRFFALQPEEPAERPTRIDLNSTGSSWAPQG